MSPLHTGTCRLYQDEVEQNTDETTFILFSFLFSFFFAGWLDCRFSVFHFFAHWLDDSCWVALGVASHLCCTFHLLSDLNSFIVVLHLSFVFAVALLI